MTTSMDLQESSTVFERIDDTSSEDGIARLTSPGVECLPATRRVRSLMPLLREGFVPLFNFQHGDVNFQNTCFIAVVANLRSLSSGEVKTNYSKKEHNLKKATQAMKP